MVLTTLIVACQAPPPPSEPTLTPAPAVTPAPTRPLAVAVAVGSPTPTPVLVGDYATLVQPRLETVQQDLKRLEQQLAAAQKAPIRMAEDDWRNQTQTILGDLLADTADVRALGARIGAGVALNADVLKVADDVDFVANEYRMALDFDPDATHLIRAGRAEKTTANELESLLGDLRRRTRAG
ncbi:MAG TPA: hypothetical protein VF937_07350 [Chloroflexota bacterium]